METNQVQAQEQPLQQLITTPAPSAKRRYNPDEAAQIVRILTEENFLDPEYILLFGKLAGGTPHSEATAYDLLVVVRQTPQVDQQAIRRIIRYHMPIRTREIPYMNLNVMPLSYVQAVKTPFLHFAHSEGELLYCNAHHHFKRPKRPINFAAAYADAKFHFDAYRLFGNELLEHAQNAFSETQNRQVAAHFTAQAAVYFYHMLYSIYHGKEFDCHDPVLMHEQMRTLSTRLMEVFDNQNAEGTYTLPQLKRFMVQMPYDLKFDIPLSELELHMDRVEKMGEIIERACGRRLELYQELSKQ